MIDQGAAIRWVSAGALVLISCALLPLAASAQDADLDGVLDGVDLCILTPDPLQVDTDSDGAGDACDCRPTTTDPDTTDADADGVFDACEATGVGPLIYREDFVGEVGFPTTPEVNTDSLSAIGYSISGNAPPVPTISGGFIDLGLVGSDGFEPFEIVAAGPAATTLDATRDVAIAAQFENVTLTSDVTGAISTVGVVLTVPSGGVLRADVIDNLGSPAFTILEGDGAGNPIGSAGVPLAAIPSSFRIELILDRSEQTIFGLLFANGIAYVTPPVALSTVVTESINTLGGLAVVANNTGVATVVTAELEDFDVYASAAIPAVDTDGDGVVDSADNCFLTPNALQLDLDGDQAGDLCDCRAATFDTDITDLDANGLFDACEAGAIGAATFAEDFEGEVSFPTTPELDLDLFGAMNANAGGNGTAMPVVGGGVVDLFVSDVSGIAGAEFVSVASGTSSLDQTRDVGLRAEFTSVALTSDPSAIASVGVTARTALGIVRVQVSNALGSPELSVIESDLVGVPFASLSHTLPQVPADFAVELQFDRASGTVVGVIEAAGEVHVSPALALTSLGLEPVLSIGGFAAVVDNLVPTTASASLERIDAFASGGPPDLDGDSVHDSLDNCVQTPNASQTDMDVDGLGDACDCRPDLLDTDLTDANGNGLIDSCEALSVGAAIYSEDFSGESFFPTTPEIDPFAVGGLSASVTGNGSPGPTIVAGGVDMSVTDVAGAEPFEALTVATMGPSLDGSRDITLAAEWSGVSITVDSNTIGSVGLLLTAADGSLFRSQVTSLQGEARFETLETDVDGITVGDSVVVLPSIPTQFRIELLIDRIAGTATGILDTGTAVYVTPPLVLSASSTQPIFSANAIAFVFNNFAPTTVTAQLDQLDLRTTGLLPLQVGDNLNRVLQHDGEQRLFDVYVPTSYVPGTSVPLVVDIHGLTSNKSAQASFSGWKSLSESPTGGFVVVWPQALFGDPADPEGVNPPGVDLFVDPLLAEGPSWNGGPLGAGAAAGISDDVGFIEEMVDTITQQLDIDRSRVYATGISNGGSMTHRLACEAEGTFAAVAAIAAPIGFTPLTDCSPARPVPTLTIQGDTDAIVPFAGGHLYPSHPDSASLPIIASAAASFQRWRDINGCSDTPTTQVLGPDSSCDTASVCNGGVETTLCTVRGLDSFGVPPVDLFGHFLYLNTDGLDLATEAWNFLQGWSRPQPEVAGTWQVTALCNDELGASVALNLTSTGAGTFDANRVEPCGLQGVFAEGLVPIDTCFTRDPLSCSVPSECATDGSYDSQGTISLPTDPTRFLPAFVSFLPQQIDNVASSCGQPWTLAAENTMSRIDGLIRHVSGVNADFMTGTLTPGRFQFLDDATPTPNLCLDIPPGFLNACDLEMRLISVVPDPVQVQTVEPVTDVEVTFPGGTLTTAATVLATDVSEPAVPAPPNFQITPDLLFDIELDPPNAISGSVEICLPYPDVNQDGFVDGVTPPSDENFITLLHEEGGAWVDITTRRDAIENFVCGETTSFSQFAAAAVPEPGIGISLLVGVGLLGGLGRRARRTLR